MKTLIYLILQKRVITHLPDLRRCVITFLLFISIVAKASSEYFFKHIGVADGLPNATISDIVQDADGIMWFATKQGLSRYDGFRFTNFETANSGISGNELNTLLLDTDNKGIWIGTERDGLNYYDFSTKKFRSFTIDRNSEDSLHLSGITDIVASGDSGIWIATYGAGVEFFHKEKKRFSHFNSHTINGMSDNPIWCVSEDKRGFLYIGYLSEGFSVFSLKEKKIKNFKFSDFSDKGPAGNEIVNIYVDPNENVWLATRNGVSLYNPVTERFRHFRHNDNNENSLLTDRVYDFTFKDNKLWIACRMGGVSILDLNQNLYDENTEIVFENIKATRQKNSLYSIHTSSLFTDLYGNVWVGFEGDGIDCFLHHPSNFRSVSTSERGKMALDLCADKGRRVWIGEDAASVSVLNDNDAWDKFRKKLPAEYDNVIFQTIYKDKSDKLWFGTFMHGIVVYDPQKDKIEFLNPDSSLPLHIRKICQLGELYYIATHHGVYVYDSYNNKFKYSELINQQIGDNIVTDIICDKFDNLWIATFSGGLSVFNSDLRLAWKSSNNADFPSFCINTLYNDLRNNIWAGSRKGLVRFTKEDIVYNKFDDFSVFDEQSGISNGCIRAVNEDILGNIWVSTNSGISCLMHDLGEFNNYFQADGIFRGEYIDGATTKDDKGFIYFASREGIIYFNPNNFYKGNIKYKVSLSDFIVLGRQDEYDEKHLNIKSDIRLHYDENSFKLNFSCKDISYESSIEYSYKLKGLEDVWYNTKDNNVTFRNLPPGNYVFELNYRLRGKEWSGDIQRLEIVINPPFWLTSYAIVLYVILALLFVLFLLNLYNKRIKAENKLAIETENHKKEERINKERLVFFTNLAHELRTPLTMILGPVQDILKENKDQAVNDKLLLINKNANSLNDLVNKIMEFRKTETSNRKLLLRFDNPAAIIDSIMKDFAKSCKNENISFKSVLEKNHSFWYDEEVLAIILNNIISNALKYTNKGIIGINSALETTTDKIYYTIKISDTGCGISEENISEIFNRYYQGNGQFQASGTGIGLALVKNLSDLHKIDINVESKVNEGTIFTLRLIADYDYPGENRVELNRTNEDRNNHETENGDITEETVILIVEDNDDIREYFGKELSSDYKVISANNGVQGKELAFKYIPDVIISDIMMPYKDGFELCKELKNDIRTSHIPIVLLTAKDSEEDKVTGYKSGADSYLTKPVSLDLLKARIGNIIDKRDKTTEYKVECKSDITERLSDRESVFVNKLSELDAGFLNKLNEIIDSILGNEDIDISLISNKLHMSHSTLYRKVKALTGGTISVYIQNRRMNKAGELLKNGDLTVLEVMYAVGMNTPAYFRKCFKEKYGCLPSEYNCKEQNKES